MSKFPLSNAHVNLLSKGPKFCPTAKGSNLNLKSDLREFTRRLKCREKFWSTEFEDNSLLKSKTFHNPTKPSQELSNIINSIENTEPIKLVNENNLSKEERNALTESTNNPNIVIQKADKVNTFVILDKEFYFKKLVEHDHLDSNIYVRIDSNSDKKVFSKLNRLIDKHAKCLTKKEYKYLTHYQWKSSNFYVMPKINKCQEILEEIEKSNDIYIQMEPPNSLKGRLIIAGPNSSTQRLSSRLEKILTPLVHKLKSCIKDD